MRSAAGHLHRVQFYDREDHLYDVAGAHLSVGLLDEEPVVVIATEVHRHQMEARLLGENHDLGAARRSGQLVMRDARETLATFMVEGTPSWELFRRHVGGLIEQSAKFRPGAQLRAYGEMVDLLWRDGNAAAALRVEQFWNDLRQVHPMSLLCAYAMDNFREAGDGRELEQVCHSHTEVEPAESFGAGAGAVGLNRQVVLLQQRSRALQTELDHRRQLESELWRQHALLSRTARFGEMFLGSLGHDLRSPLLAMVTAAGLLLRRFEGDDASRLAQRILSSAGRMDRMIDQLLDFTRIRLGQGLPLTRRNVDLRSLCQEVLDESEGVDHRRSVIIDAQGDTWGFWDRDRLGQLLFSLMENALVHGEREQPVSVCVDGTARDQVLLEVHNAGEIPAGQQLSVFEPFRQVEGLKQVGGSGLGLGLFLSEQIALAHGGDIRVASSRAEGTSFRVALPRVVALA